MQLPASPPRRAAASSPATTTIGTHHRCHHHRAKVYNISCSPLPLLSLSHTPTPIYSASFLPIFSIDLTSRRLVASSPRAVFSVNPPSALISHPALPYPTAFPDPQPQNHTKPLSAPVCPERLRAFFFPAFSPTTSRTPSTASPLLTYAPSPIFPFFSPPPPSQQPCLPLLELFARLPPTPSVSP